MEHDLLGFLYAKGLATNYNKWLQQKGGLDYLRWAKAVCEFFKTYPDGSFGRMDSVIEDIEIKDDGRRTTQVSHLNYWPDTGGPFIRIWLKRFPHEAAFKFDYPISEHVQGGAFEPIHKPTNEEVNTNFMRGLVKIIAIRTGIGLYVYTGTKNPLDMFGGSDKADQALIDEWFGILKQFSENDEYGKKLDEFVTKGEYLHEDVKGAIDAGQKYLDAKTAVASAK